MNGWLITLGSILLIMTIVWFTSVRIEIVYKRAAENDRVEVEVSLYKRLLKYRFTVNLLQLESLSKGIKVARESEVGWGEEEEEKKKMWITPQLIARYKERFIRLRHQIHDLNHILLQTTKRIQGVKLEWKTSIGLGEASATGAIIGVVWILKSTAVAVLAHYITLRVPPRLYVIPEFQREMLDVHLLCIFRLRIGHAIIAVIRIAVHYFWKGRERTWENIRFKA
ncbi:DUF2953 domain-containing protein [Aneurinibacillus sp. BA2021]|nr:DUF2953 domain-containing protein [Aneurinibacillus sp. BA2021]